LRRLDLVVAVSQAELALISSVRSPPKNCVVWPGFDIDPRPRSTTTPSRPLILYVGRLSAAKGVDAVLRAAALLTSACDLVVVGDGPARERCETLCRDLGMDPSSVLVGTLTDSQVDELLGRADVFVSVSSQEAFGIAVLKALAHGCRPVVSDIPSHREIVTTLGVGAECLQPMPADPVALAASIERALTRPRPTMLDAIPSWTDSAAALVEGYERIRRH
jgi:glycosyltransferase involved in cell wall biosynthesis